MALVPLVNAADPPQWLRYPAISADGEQIAFSYGGDLYLVATIGGDAVHLTQHQAHDFMPVWSPDSKTIAFASDRFGNFDVFTVSASGGNAKRLTFHSADDFKSPSASPTRRSRNAVSAFLPVAGLSSTALNATRAGTSTFRESSATSSEMALRPADERAYMFEHSWRQLKKKFYVEDLHGVDWDFYKREYARCLPHINNNYDFSELLSGEPYIQFFPRGQDNMGAEPMFKWSKPSAVLMGEGNYSDAHMFPFAYKALGIGKLVGMPVPGTGTGTAVWWETLIDPTLYFGIPQVGMRASDGHLLENTQLEPDIKVSNTPEDLATGRDRQLEAAIDELLKKK